jgi:hypothetical protein
MVHVSQNHSQPRPADIRRAQHALPAPAAPPRPLPCSCRRRRHGRRAPPDGAAAGEGGGVGARRAVLLPGSGGEVREAPGGRPAKGSRVCWRSRGNTPLPCPAFAWALHGLPLCGSISRRWRRGGSNGSCASVWQHAPSGPAPYPTPRIAAPPRQGSRRGSARGAHRGSAARPA